MLFLAPLLVGGGALAAPPSDSTLHITGRGAERASVLDCASDPCGDMLPDAVRFEAAERWATGTDADGDVVGWVGLSTQIVDIKGYSGKPLHTLVAVAPDGTIAGAQVVFHSEPILLVGIPEQELVDFVDEHVGLRADDKVVVGGKSSADQHAIDVVSGATVTVLAESQTILETARHLAEGVGVIDAAPRVPGHFVDTTERWDWAKITREEALGHLVVMPSAIGETGDQPHMDLWFGIVDAPHVGIPLLGERTWTWATGELEPGEHLVVLLNRGTGTFRGSGFVRGGIFDRFRIEQGLRSVVFRDMDYTRIPSPDGTPDFPEAGLFVARGLDPGVKWDMVYLASTYATERGAFQRDFATFRATHRTPKSVYVLDGPDPETLIWRRAWANGWPSALATGLLYLGIIGLFANRRFLAGSMQRLRTMHLSVAVLSFFGFGLFLHVQPSITQVLTVLGTSKSGWDWNLFLSDPVLVVSWVAIVAIIPIWGRGVFCGWLCPYGALNELVFKLGHKLGVRNRELPDGLHFKLRYLRYAIFAGLLVVYLWRADVGEMLAEVEPFKSTFFVPIWTRHPGLILWWTALLAWAVTTYRPFCRYLCPLGAALALPSSIRLSSPYRRDFCSKCKICTRGCEPRAIRPDGTIDPRECLNCMECEANWQDDTVCPPLVKIRRDRERAA